MRESAVVERVRRTAPKGAAASAGRWTLTSARAAVSRRADCERETEHQQDPDAEPDPDLRPLDLSTGARDGDRRRLVDRLGVEPIVVGDEVVIRACRATGCHLPEERRVVAVCAAERLAPKHDCLGRRILLDDRLILPERGRNGKDKGCSENRDGGHVAIHKVFLLLLGDLHGHLHRG